MAINKRILYTTIAISGVALIVGGSIAALSLMKNKSEAEPPKKQPQIAFTDEIEETLSTESFSGAFSVLIIGSDSREGQRYNDGVEGEMNDVTMLMKVDETHQRADIISFPRDAIVPMGICTGGDPNGDYQQINTGLMLGGSECVKSSIENLTGEAIDATALVSFDAVEALTEAVGGIPVCIAEPIYSYHTGDLVFAEGEHRLSGPQALDLVRERYGFGDGGDLGRIYNQQVFLQSFLKEFRNADFMDEPEKFWNLTAATLANLKLSTNLQNPENLLQFANTFLEVPTENYQFYTAPVSTNADDPNRLSLNNEQLAELIAYINTPPLVIETTPEPPAEDSATAPDAEEENLPKKTEIVIPAMPENLPKMDMYAPRTGEASTVTVCG